MRVGHSVAEGIKVGPFVGPQILFLQSHIFEEINILDKSKLDIANVMTKENISSGIPLIFSLSRNPRTSLFGILEEVLISLLLTTIYSAIFFSSYPWVLLVALGAFPIMEVMHCRFPFNPSSSPLLASFHFLPYTTSTTFLGDYFLFKDSSQLFFQSLVYSDNLPFLISTSIASLSLMKLLML